MMQKGQISLDLMVSLIVVVIVTGALWTIVNNFNDTQEKFLIQRQLDESSQKIASFITTTQVLADTNFSSEISLEKINYTDINGSNKTVYPTVKISGDVLNLSIIINLKNGTTTMDSNAYFSKSLNTTITTNTKKTALVIKNE